MFGGKLWVTCLLLCGVFLSAAAFAERDSFELVTPTDQEHGEHAGKVHLNHGVRTLGELPEILKAYYRALPEALRTKSDRPTLVFYFSPDRSDEEIELAVKSAVDGVSEKLGVVPKIEVHFRTAEESVEALREATSGIGEVELARELVAAVDETESEIRPAQREREWRRRERALEGRRTSLRDRLADFTNWVSQPSEQNSVGLRLAVAKAMYVVAVTTGNVLRGGADKVSPTTHPLGTTAIVADASVDLVYTLFQERLNQRLARLAPPEWENGPPLYQRLQRWLRDNPRMQYFKAFVGNFAVFAIGRPLGLKALVHANDPAVQQAVTSGDFAVFGGFGGADVGFYVFGERGLQNLYLKGYIGLGGKQARLRAAGLGETTGLAFGKTGTMTGYAFASAGLIGAWAMFTRWAILGATLPSRTDRFVFVDPAVRRAEVIESEAAYAHALPVDGKKSSDVLRALKKVAVARCQENLERLKSRGAKG